MKSHVMLEESDIVGYAEDGKLQLTPTARKAMWTAELVTFGNQILKDRRWRYFKTSWTTCNPTAPIR